MLVELYFTLLNMVMQYGELQTLLIISFLTSVVVFAAAAAAKKALQGKGPWYFTGFMTTRESPQ